MLEIEIKSLLGDKEKADALRQRLKDMDPDLELVSKHKQLNHYFIGDNFDGLFENISPLLKDRERLGLKKIIDEGKDLSVRTRQMEGRAFLVVKASIDDTTSANGILRTEFEEEIPGKTLEEVDQVLINSGFKYQSRWSREREEYKMGKNSVTIDRNAGYGHVAEFERVVEDATKAEEIKMELRELMERLGLEELPQDRLERMFQYYNEHWPAYYGTDEIFVID